MKTYDIYISPEQEIKIVKQGFSWPAFLFSFIWALIRGHWPLALILIGLAVLEILILLPFIYSESFLLGAVVCEMIRVGVLIYLGLNGNNIVRQRLIEKGCSHIKSIDSQTFPSFTQEEHEDLVKTGHNATNDVIRESLDVTPIAPILEPKKLLKKIRVKTGSVENDSVGKSTSSGTSQSSRKAKLEELKDLLSEGLISEAEYSSMKTKILSTINN